jgi:hypothetical protein
VIGSALSAPANNRIGTKLTVACGMLLAAAGLAILASATPASSYDRVLAALLLAGSGIGVAMAPATDSVMGSLPRVKASIGSAMNDTARLVGGAFGVAVLGSIISLGYRTHIAAAAAQLPSRTAGPAQGSLQGALQVAQHLGGPPGRVLETAARLAFTDAMNRAALIGAAVALAAALVALVLLPARAAQEPRSSKPR